MGNMLDVTNTGLTLSEWNELHGKVDSEKTVHVHCGNQLQHGEVQPPHYMQGKSESEKKKRAEELAARLVELEEQGLI